MAKILIVDDDADLTKRIRDWLVYEKYSVEVASNGADALQLLESYPYDLIILDWELPDVDGISICRASRQS
jgi:DNA-binding response OmpR family regulator